MGKSILDTRLASVEVTDAFFTIIRNMTFSTIVIWAGGKIAPLSVNGKPSLVISVIGNFIAYVGLALIMLTCFNGLLRIRELGFKSFNRLLLQAICFIIVITVGAAWLLKQSGQM